MTKIDKPEVDDRITTIDDEKKRVIDFWDMTLPVPEVGIYDEPTRCYKINKEWAKIVMGLVSWLADVAAWKEAQHEGYPAIQEILKFLQGDDCVDCNAVIDCLNQNPDWISLQNIQATDMAQTTEEFLAELEDLYDGTNPNSINPDIPTDAPNIASEENALCYALASWVRLYCEAKELKIRQANFLSQAWNAMQDAIVDAYGVLNNIIGFILPDDLFSCFVDFDEALTVLNDETAISDLICCLYGELKDIALLEGSLEGAINACVGSLSGNAQKLACIISNDLNLQHTLNFFFIYGRSLNRQMEGELLECECETWQYSYLDYKFVYSDHEFTATLGSYVDGQYWNGAPVVVFPPTSKVTAINVAKLLGGTAKVVGIGMNYYGETDCGITGLSANVLADGVGVGGFSTSPIFTGTNVFRTYGLSTPGTSYDGNEITVNISSRLCNGLQPTTRLFWVRVWLHQDSVIKGIPSDVVPYGTGANGTSDMVWWQ